MNITVANIISAIKRHLSTIGKRLYSKDGKNMFSNITLSSAEDPQLLTQYVNASAQDIEAVLKQFVTASSYGATISMTITNTRGDEDFEARTQALAESYITLNSVGEYLSMVHPDLAQKYHADASQRMESLMTYVIYKNPPGVSGYKYPSSIEVEEESIDIGIGEAYIIAYSILPSDSIDDVEIRVEDGKLIDAGRTEKGFTVVGKQLGHTYVQVFSRHNASLTQTVQVYITDQS